MLAQSAHAATAVLHKYRDHPDVKHYLEGEDGRGWEVMRKVTYEVQYSPSQRANPDGAGTGRGSHEEIGGHVGRLGAARSIPSMDGAAVSAGSALLSRST
jgi:hypothetical protein